MFCVIFESQIWAVCVSWYSAKWRAPNKTNAHEAAQQIDLNKMNENSSIDARKLYANTAPWTSGLALSLPRSLSSSTSIHLHVEKQTVT